MKRATHFSVQPGWRLLLSDMGLRPEDVLKLSGLPGDLFSRKGATITTEQYFRFWEVIEASAGATSLPLRIGQAISAEAFDAPIFASLCSPNLNVALERLSAYKQLIGPMTLTVEVRKDRTVATVAFLAHEGTLPGSLAITELVFLTQLARLGTRHRMIPLEVKTPRIPENPAAYEEFFGVPMRKGSAIQVSFRQVDCVRPFLTSNEAMWEYFEPSLRARLSSLDSDAKMSDRVTAVLLEGLPTGEYSIDSVAKRLALSKRSLQRQLSEEATNFKDVLGATRRRLAQHYLKTPSLSQGEIAFLLGFQEVNSFTRAFKDWTGTTPGVFRGAHTAR